MLYLFFSVDSYDLMKESVQCANGHGVCLQCAGIWAHIYNIDDEDPDGMNLTSDSDRWWLWKVQHHFFYPLNVQVFRDPAQALSARRELFRNIGLPSTRYQLSWSARFWRK